jgi:hypothetical protein
MIASLAAGGMSGNHPIEVIATGYLRRRPHDQQFQLPQHLGA